MRAILALLALFPLAVGTGCLLYVEDDDNRIPSNLGDLTVRYTFDRTDCEKAGVDRIQVVVNGEDYGDRFSDRVDCTEYLFGITIENLFEDRYRVTVEGLSRGGDVLFSTTSRQTVDVLAGVLVETTVHTVGTGGDLRVFWTFDGSGQCGVVSDVRVSLIDPDGFLYDEQLYPCDYAGVEYVSVQQGLWTVSLYGLDARGRVLYQISDQGVVVIRGADNTHSLDLGPRA